MLKGGGSENATALGLLNQPRASKPQEIRGRLRDQGRRPTVPPNDSGIATGGGADVALELAKKTLLRPLSTFSPEPQIAKLEKELLEAINKTGIGPMGLGGDTTP